MAKDDLKDEKENENEDGVNKPTFSKAGGGDADTDVVSAGGANVGDTVFAVYRNVVDAPESHKVPAIITAVHDAKDANGNQLVNVKVFNDSHISDWCENVSLYSGKGPKDDDENVIYKQGIYVTTKR